MQCQWAAKEPLTQPIIRNNAMDSASYSRSTSVEVGRPSVPGIGESKTSAAVNMSSAPTQAVGKRKRALLFPGMPAQLFAIGEPLPYFPGSVQSIDAFINACIMQVGHLLYGKAT